MADDWTDEENDAIVADYFAMLAEDVARRPYNKAEHNRKLQTAIDRPHASIEYKHRNIGARGTEGPWGGLDSQMQARVQMSLQSKIDGTALLACIISRSRKFLATIHLMDSRRCW